MDPLIKLCNAKTGRVINFNKKNYRVITTGFNLVVKKKVLAKSGRVIEIGFNLVVKKNNSKKKMWKNIKIDYKACELGVVC